MIFLRDNRFSQDFREVAIICDIKFVRTMILPPRGLARFLPVLVADRIPQTLPGNSEWPGRNSLNKARLPAESEMA